MRIVVLVTHPMTARLLLRGQLRYLREAGHEVTLVTSPGPDLEGLAETEGVEVRTVPMAREISPARDLIALARLCRLLGRLRPDVVVAGTPKAGFLGMVAARWTQVPARVYTLRGLRVETARGWKRRLLLWTERTACASAHRVLCVSHSLRTRAVELELVDGAKAIVPGAGSSNGVDVERFEAAAADRERIRALRAELGLPEGVPVVGFVGRFTRDKGIVELVEAFDRVGGVLPHARLLLLGDFEEGDPVPSAVAGRLRDDRRVVRPGFVLDTAPYYPLMDALVFPSHREGFPNAPLEAAAAGVPTAGYAATGVVDAVVHGQTGTLVRIGDVAGLSRALVSYLGNPDLRRLHGDAARERVRGTFRREKVWSDWEAALRGAATP